MLLSRRVSFICAAYFFFSSFLLFHPLEFSSCWHLRMWFHLTRSTCQRLTTFCSRPCYPQTCDILTSTAQKNLLIHSLKVTISRDVLFMSIQIHDTVATGSLTRRLPVKVTNQEEEHSASLSGTLYSLSSDSLKSFLLFIPPLFTDIPTSNKHHCVEKSSTLVFLLVCSGWRDNLVFYEEVFFFMSVCVWIIKEIWAV